MLSLKQIVKSYVTGDTAVTALKGVSIDFRKNEFVSILGPSGCGKTTLLNIIGGLDRYDSGNLIIKGRSTQSFKDRDWDSYRNHSIGFVFQSYNLIPHQSVLSNVELALTLSGVSKAERKRRAKEALEKVGLGDQLHKKPNQMSGGQMQRVAIARALVNDPEIILADEPTGALDSVTSVQIMDILKSIAHEKLIIMVTHNPDLANKYSSRIIRLSDGLVVDDTNPYDPEKDENAIKTAGTTTNTPTEKKKKAKKEKTSMSFLTALNLSLNNLMTKKGRTFLTSFAGSIGIIGIALILSLSNGIDVYIRKVQEDSLTSYPISIQAASMDMSAMMTAMMGQTTSTEPHELDAVYTNTMITDMIKSMVSGVKINNMKAFKAHLDSKEDQLIQNKLVNDIQYGYNLSLNIYDTDTSNGVKKLGMDEFLNTMRESLGTASVSVNVFTEMIDNKALLESQYDIVKGHLPENYDEVVLVVNENNELADMAFYALGLKDQSELMEIFAAAMKGETYDVEPITVSYEDILNTKFKLVLTGNLYEKDASGIWQSIENNPDAMKRVVDSSPELKVVGILRPAEDAISTAISSPIAYTHALTEYIITENNNTPIIKEQLANPGVNVFTSQPFPSADVLASSNNLEKTKAFISYASALPVEEKADLYLKMTPSTTDLLPFMMQFQQMDSEQLRAMLIDAALKNLPDQDSDTIKNMISLMGDDEVISTMATAAFLQQAAALPVEQRAAAMDSYLSGLTANVTVGAQLYEDYVNVTYDKNLSQLGQLDLDNPMSISIYPTNFEAKEQIEQLIKDYNNSVTDDDDKISYTDYVAILMSSVTTIVDFVSYALIAFVSISLVVSSIMIGIITYISVLERTKEIGILRSIGASKKDISRVFNAETFIVGLAAGIIGIGVSVLLCIPINLIISSLADVSRIAIMPIAGAIFLVVISVGLTMIAGLLPSKMAAKKDPVIALRTE